MSEERLSTTEKLELAKEEARLSWRGLSYSLFRRRAIISDPGILRDNGTRELLFASAQQDAEGLKLVMGLLRDMEELGIIRLAEDDHGLLVVHEPLLLEMSKRVLTREERTMLKDTRISIDGRDYLPSDLGLIITDVEVLKILSELPPGSYERKVFFDSGFYTSGSYDQRSSAFVGSIKKLTKPLSAEGIQPLLSAEGDGKTPMCYCPARTFAVDGIGLQPPTKN